MSKVAICLHGYFDSLTDSKSFGADGYRHLQKHVYEKLSVKPDIFIHSWQPELADMINKLYNPVAYTYQPQKNFDAIVNSRHLSDMQSKYNSPRSPQVVLSHFYSIQEAFRLCYSADNNYDIVIKARFDIGRINRNPKRTPVQCINFQTNILPKRIYMADWEMFNQGPADMWFYGCSDTMENFAYIYDYLERSFYLDSRYHAFAQSIGNRYGDLSNSVVFYQWWMRQNDLWENKVPLECTFE